MESVHHEQQLPLPVVKTVRDRIIAFHDRHLLVAPVAQDAAGAFEHVAGVITSKKGNAVVEKIRPHMATWSKNIELGTAAGDMVLGLIGSVVGAEGVIGGLADKQRVVRGTSVLDASVMATATGELTKDIRPRVKRGLIGVGTGGVFLGLRPITWLTDAVYRYGRPIARSIAGTVDGILLRKEKKQEAQQVFVGRGKA